MKTQGTPMEPPPVPDDQPYWPGEPERFLLGLGGDGFVLGHRAEITDCDLTPKQLDSELKQRAKSLDRGFGFGCTPR